MAGIATLSGGTRLGGGLALALALAACRSAPAPREADTLDGRVGMQDITRAMPAGAWQLADNETLLMPLEESGNRAPDYPQALLSDRLPPVQVCLRLSIGTDGRVAQADPIAPGEDCQAADAIAPGFLQAARDAVAGWRFDPAFRCVYASAADKAAAGDGCEGGEVVPEAISLAYRFVFEQHEGRGTVRIGP
ncbi:hypothetical protein [Marilutibacter spongiae]|uniref:TonB C-terminal domain-containing protein n=1 Tax=Marilutibacter spongiae TaxID=2025720 RepID=A0A7W3TK19_9GAMM|nr:hypothetical protein [Lysobacter spongiae]MBB1059793.1 hypothetical protein [Lysobacter spongiae]